MASFPAPHAGHKMSCSSLLGSLWDRVAAWWHCRRPLLLLQCSGPVSVYTQGLNLGLDLILVLVLSQSLPPWSWSCL